ncbi:MAG: C-terminal helicase domain-containing protein, partial [Muribaculaceae bacterium]|nr:C-terminal helicase domain-containing protein [Muribaculaceae bacterium]
PPNRAIVFSSSKLKVKELAKEFRHNKKIRIGEMHSDLEQNLREEIILKFKAGKINVLFATDIVARGIDVDDIDLVLNYDVPREGEDYVHRVGRTARTNKDGVALTFISDKERSKFRSIERLLGKEVEKLPVDPAFGATPDYSTAETKKKRRFPYYSGNNSRKNRNHNHRNSKTPSKNKKSDSSSKS